jgi:ADP-ribose pyrophosphatase YjhB (NUDIX family)
MTLRPVSALALTRGNDEWLLQFRSHDAPTHPHMWALFGGGQEPNETATSALYREVIEEIGLHLAAAQVGVYEFPEDGLSCTLFISGLQPDDHGGQSLAFMTQAQTEGATLGFFRWSDIEQMRVVPHVVELLRHAREWLSR